MRQLQQKYSTVLRHFADETIYLQMNETEKQLVSASSAKVSAADLVQNVTTSSFAHLLALVVFV